MPFRRKRSPDGATLTEVPKQTSNYSLLLIYRPRKDERLSWPGWLTYSGWFTHVSGYPSAAGRAQDRESSPASVPRNLSVLPEAVKGVPNQYVVCICVSGTM